MFRFFFNLYKREQMEKKKTIEKLTKIAGIGSRMAESLYKQGIRNKKDLKKKEIFEILPAATKADLKYNPNKRIPRNIIEILEKKLRQVLIRVPFMITGSYRRKKPISRDLDIVVRKDKLKRKKKEPYQVLIDMINKRQQSKSKITMLEPFSKGEDKISTILQIDAPSAPSAKKMHIKVDIFLATPEEWVPTILYTTGSREFNIRMRSVAKRKGYLLNRRGLFKKIDGNMMERISLDSEFRVFQELGITWKIPADRID